LILQNGKRLNLMNKNTFFSAGGYILKSAVLRYTAIAAFQPVINGK
jgi:hypothetical protein